MKKIYLFLIVVIIATLAACAHKEEIGDGSTVPDNTTPAVIIEDPVEPDEPAVVDEPVDEQPDDDPVIEDEPEPEPVEQFNPSFVILTNNSAYLSDPETTKTEIIGTGTIDRAGAKTFLINSEVHIFDASGDVIEIVSLDSNPVQAKLSGGELYTCIQYAADEAYAAGGLYRIYSEFFKDGASMGPWYLNQMECRDILSAGGEPFAVNESGAAMSLSGDITWIEKVFDDKFFTHTIDLSNKRIGFNANTESYVQNYVFTASQWVYYDGLYYSELGATWSAESGLDEFSTSMSAFKAAPYPIDPELQHGESPVLLGVGAHNDGIYWIECNTGWLVRYDIESDTTFQEWQIYAGDGTHLMGVNKRDILNPLFVDNWVYFSNDSTLYRLQLETGFIQIVFAGPAEAWEF